MTMPDKLIRGSHSARVFMDLVKPTEYQDSKLRSVGQFLLPPFQRPPVWTRCQQVKLIESIWLGLPIGALVYNQTGYGRPCDMWLLDGQQRMTAIMAYMAGKFDVFGWYYHTLPDRERRQWDFTTPVSAIETNIEEPEVCRDIYNRLAYGGTAHE